MSKDSRIAAMSAESATLRMARAERHFKVSTLRERHYMSKDSRIAAMSAESATLPAKLDSAWAQG